LAVEDAVEAVLGAVLLDVDVPPRSTLDGIPAVDPHLEPAGTQPLSQQLRIDVRAIDEITRRVELAADVDERDVLRGSDREFGHGILLQSCRLVIGRGVAGAWRAARR